MTDTTPRFGPPDGWEAAPTRPFTLYGRTLEDDEPWEETFSIVGQAPQGALADLAEGITIKDGVVRYSTVATVAFLRAVIAPVDELRFDVLLADKNRPVHIDQLGAVMLWAATEVAGRPTGPLPSSTDGQRPTEDGSEAERSGPVTTPTG